MKALALFASISRLHIVAIAALGTFTFGWVFTQQHLWLLAGVSALDWFLVNLLNRAVDIPEDRANGISGAEFAAKHRRVLLVGSFTVLFSSLLAVHGVQPRILPLRLAYHALGLAYNWPLLPGGRRIKQCYFWKNTASATGFLLTVFLYPLASVGWGFAPQQLAPGITLGTIATTAVFFALFELSYEVIYDLRDVAGDKLADVASFPVVHGTAGAIRIIDSLLATSMGCLVVGYTLKVVPWRIFIMIAAPAAQLFLYKRAVRRGLTSRDCIGLTWLGVMFLISYHLWIAAGLPGIGLT